jgi:hypothetical protein
MSDFSNIIEQLKKREQELDDRREQLKDLVLDITETERARVIKKAGKDFWYFCKKVFPEYCSKPFSDLHREIKECSDEKKRLVHVFAGPPEHGKTIIMRLYKIWCALYGHRHYIIKITETMDLSLIDCESIKLEFENNPRLIFLYGNLRTAGHWETGAFKVAPTKFNKYGTWFEAFAYGVPPTGRVREWFRPDFCDIDDLESYRKSGNVEISRDKLEFINNDIIPRLSNDAPIIWFGNNARKTMAMNIIIDMEPTERKEKFPAFIIHLFPAWDRKKNRPLWHEAYKFDTEEEMRLFFGVGMMTWLGNYMQCPVVPSGLEFKLANWRSYSKLPDDALGIMMCDPAGGTKTCFKAIGILLFSVTTSKFYAPDCFVRQCDWEPYFIGMYKLYNRYEKHIRFIGWEEDFHQSQFLLFRKLYPTVKDKPPLPIRPITVKGSGPKPERIRKLTVPYEVGDILFHEDFLKSKEGIEAQSHLTGFPDYPYLDYADALGSAYREVFRMFAGKYINDMDSHEAYESLGKTRVNRNSF